MRTLLVHSDGHQFASAVDDVCGGQSPMHTSDATRETASALTGLHSLLWSVSSTDPGGDPVSGRVDAAGLAVRRGVWTPVLEALAASPQGTATVSAPMIFESHHGDVSYSLLGRMCGGRF